jgi:integrase
LILTGCRVSEAANIAASELDLAAALWRLPAERAKNGRSITLPLSPLALGELTAVLPDPLPGGEYRLLGRIRGSGLNGISNIKERLDDGSGVTAWKMHDLRRTCRTGMARLGVLAEHAELALNHVSNRTALQRTYDVHDYEDEVLAALTRWQMHVATILGNPPESAEVIRLRA